MRERKEDSELHTVAETKMPVVEIAVGNSLLRTLFDTGSRYNVLCVSAHKKIGEPPMIFRGFGAAETRACGTVTIDVCVDGETYPSMMFYVVPT